MTQNVSILTECLTKWPNPRGAFALLCFLSRRPCSSLGSFLGSAARDLLIPSTWTVTIEGRGFSTAGPVAWNSLPMDLKDGIFTFPVFKKLLKTHLFDTIWTAALRLCGNCIKGALQVPVSIQFNSFPSWIDNIHRDLNMCWTSSTQRLWSWVSSLESSYLFIHAYS